MKRRLRAISRPAPALKRLVTLFALLAFALQAYLVQTHIHLPPSPALQVASHAAAPDRPLPTDPLDPATCRLCQEIVHAGAAITPAVPEILLVLGWIATASTVALLPATAFAPQTGWQSRAPPRR